MNNDFGDFIKVIDQDDISECFRRCADTYKDVRFTKDEQAFIFQFTFDTILSVLNDYHNWYTSQKRC